MKRNKKFNILIFLIITLALAFSVISFKRYLVGDLNIYPRKSFNSAYNGVIEQQTKTYQSKNLKFSISIPNEGKIIEKNTYVDINFNSGLIDVVRNGTNFNSLDEYLVDYDQKKKIQILDVNKILINEASAIGRIELNPDTNVKQKIYYIYIDNWVYAISTNSESLFKDLEQIAQSFKYTP